jgi:hypothetical protein
MRPRSKRRSGVVNRLLSLSSAGCVVRPFSIGALLGREIDSKPSRATVGVTSVARFFLVDSPKHRRRLGRRQACPAAGSGALGSWPCNRPCPSAANSLPPRVRSGNSQPFNPSVAGEAHRRRHRPRPRESPPATGWTADPSLGGNRYCRRQLRFSPTGDPVPGSSAACARANGLFASRGLNDARLRRAAGVCALRRR